MKRFEVAVEISKQLIAIASAVFVGIAALASEIFQNEQDWRVFTVLLFVYGILAFSILAGILHFGAVVNLIETAERSEKSQENWIGIPDIKNKFVSVFDNKWAPIFVMLQQFCVFIAFILLICALIIDRTIS